MTNIRRRYQINGIVQGVGFRPFVYRQATALQLSGWICNSPAGVELELQGSSADLDSFDHVLCHGTPPLALISSLLRTDIPPGEETGFSILPSTGGAADIRIAPDSATCDDCLRELGDPTDRRYRYPFITCTNCGPRYSIITGIPYDRPLTTMAGFPLCSDCQREYEDPGDRRFHAQPIACHNCGPQVQLRSATGVSLGTREEAILEAVRQLKAGAIVAVKGLGGYHLAVDPCNHTAVALLRQRKERDEKPFALMAATIDAARALATLTEQEEQLLTSPEAPIIIVRKRDHTGLSPLIAPHNDWLGLMLPSTPLHHLLLGEHFNQLVMTSGNSSDEPVAYDDRDALQRLSGIADCFLTHDRPIHIRNDDSVIRVFQGGPLFYRRARGYAPRATPLPFAVPPLLATGAELKGAVCLASGTTAVVSQHIGDLQNRSTYDAFTHTISHLSTLLEIRPELIACDLHPDYLSSRFAEESGLPVIPVQHHHAHMASAMVEHGLEGDVIGLIFDGTGYGTDGTIWGGEFLIGGYDRFTRAGHFRTIPLPGGDAAIREPWRMAMSYLYQALGEEAFTCGHPVTSLLPDADRPLFAQMLRRGINSPHSSSCGRLFDAVGALLNIRHRVSYDGQGAIELEALAEGAQEDLPPSDEEYSYRLLYPDSAPFQVDFCPLIRELMAHTADRIPPATTALRFHRTVAAAATEACRRIAAESGLNHVILSGGVFQNRLLTEMIYTALTNGGLTVHTQRVVPPNDGGIALGQAAIAGRRTT